MMAALKLALGFQVRPSQAAPEFEKARLPLAPEGAPRVVGLAFAAA